MHCTCEVSCWPACPSAAAARRLPCTIYIHTCVSRTHRRLRCGGALEDNPRLGYRLRAARFRVFAPTVLRACTNSNERWWRAAINCAESPGVFLPLPPPPTANEQPCCSPAAAAAILSRFRALGTTDGGQHWGAAGFEMCVLVLRVPAYGQAEASYAGTRPPLGEPIVRLLVGTAVSCRLRQLPIPRGCVPIASQNSPDFVCTDNPCTTVNSRPCCMFVLPACSAIGRFWIAGLHTNRSRTRSPPPLSWYIHN